ncbi:MAG: SOS response-associated peptidase [Phycisphaeraceae bacterium]|nr:SOS response-associated peptidase [Phycisphaeraceae bacterium]
MCGRYTLKSKLDRLARQLFLAGRLPHLPPRYNIAPSQPVPAILTAPSCKREMRLLRWGLVPHWAKDITIGSKLINARVETLAQKPAFRDALRYRRCLIPADGFYEWRTSTPAEDDASNARRSSRASSRGAAKQPHYIHRPDHQPFLFAGLHEHWQDPHGNELDTCSIITTDASPPLSAIYPRMPLILPPALWQAWLDPGTHADAVAQLLADAVQDPGEKLEATPVSRAVNRATIDTPQLIAPVVIPPPAEDAPRPNLFDS